METDFVSVTELSGDEVSQEQVERMCQRYYWAGTFCSGKDVLEVACGTGQGAGYLSSLSKSYQAADYSEEILKIARAHYRRRIDFRQFDAQQIPLVDTSLDVVILFEAIYYIPSVDRFVSECRRVLRSGGKVLIATANKDLFDFNPSPHSHIYYGVQEMGELFDKLGFQCEFFGDTPVNSISLRQKMLRPIKKFVVQMGLMPKSMAAKKLIKRLVFGSLVPMPAEVKPEMFTYNEPTLLPSGRPDRRHKVIYCVATLQK